MSSPKDDRVMQLLQAIGEVDLQYVQESTPHVPVDKDSLPASNHTKVKRLWPLLLAAALVVVLPAAAIAGSQLFKNVQVVDISAEDNSAVRSTEWGTVSVKRVIVIEGVSYELYETFDDSASALACISREEPEFIGFLQSMYHLPELSDQSWEQYRDMAILANNADSKWGDSYIALSRFFDMYENDSKNKEIIELARTGGYKAVQYLLPDK